MVGGVTCPTGEGADSPDLAGQGEAGQARSPGCSYVFLSEEGQEEHFRHREKQRQRHIRLRDCQEEEAKERGERRDWPIGQG